jgi:hypothetical protein
MRDAHECIGGGANFFRIRRLAWVSNLDTMLFFLVSNFCKQESALMSIKPNGTSCADVIEFELVSGGLPGGCYLWLSRLRTVGPHAVRLAVELRLPMTVIITAGSVFPSRR